MASLIHQLSRYRLTTAEILYHLPDHPSLLQSYTWQDYDLTPEFPSCASSWNSGPAASRASFIR